MHNDEHPEDSDAVEEDDSLSQSTGPTTTTTDRQKSMTETLNSVASSSSSPTPTTSTGTSTHSSSGRKCVPWVMRFSSGLLVRVGYLLRREETTLFCPHPPLNSPPLSLLSCAEELTPPMDARVFQPAHLPQVSPPSELQRLVLRFGDFLVPFFRFLDTPALLTIGNVPLW